MQVRSTLLFIISIAITGCCAPSARLPFPTHPLKKIGAFTWYDVSHDGKPGFATLQDDSGQVISICYSDLEDGVPSRSYRLRDYATKDVPHVILLLDSVPYQSMVDFYNAGHLRFFDFPQKVIAPFPSLTEVCYSDVLHAPPLTGMIDQSYDPRLRRRRDALWDRIDGYSEPWERRLDYHAKFWEWGLSFMDPRPWYAAELERGIETINASATQTTIVYIGSASSMICKYGKPGIDETLLAAEQFCLQLLFERHGAIRISMMADHGHNLMHSINVPVDDFLRQAGFNPASSLQHQDDVVVEINGLVTYAGVQTSRPTQVAWALVQHPQIELVMYQEADRILVRNAHMISAIECREGRLRYVPIVGDILGFKPLIAKLKLSGEMDESGYMSDGDWLGNTAEGPWPDAPRRIWDAFHRISMYPPAVMFTLHDGYCAGLKEYEQYIDMASTHGGLNQLNSATFVMTMNGQKSVGPLRSRDVINWLAPGFEPLVHAW